MRSTKQELEACYRELRVRCGGPEIADECLHRARADVGVKVKIGPYSGGEWTATWFEGRKETTRWRRLRLTVDEIQTPGRVLAVVRAAFRNTSGEV
jgi:hypothetical protein